MVSREVIRSNSSLTKSRDEEEALHKSSKHESNTTIPAGHSVGEDDPSGQNEPVPNQMATINNVNTPVKLYKLYLRDSESLKMILLDSTNLQTKLWTNKGRRTILFLMNVLDALAPTPTLTLTLTPTLTLILTLTLTLTPNYNPKHIPLPSPNP